MGIKRRNTLISIVLIASIFLLTWSYGVYMPMGFVYTSLAALIAAFMLFTIVVMSEKSLDEREDSILKKGSKYGYITGTLMLLTITIVRLFQHDLDIWIPITLGVMIAVRTFTVTSDPRE